MVSDRLTLERRQKDAEKSNWHQLVSHRLNRWALLAGLAVVCVPAFISTISAQGGGGRFEKVREIEVGSLGVGRSAGLAYAGGGSEHFLLVQARQSNRPGARESDIVYVDPFGRSAGEGRISTAVDDPINITYDATANRLLLLTRDGTQLLAVPAQVDGTLMDDEHSTYSIEYAGLQDPQGISVDPLSGDLMVLDSAVPALVRVEPAPDGSFVAAVTSLIDLSHFGAIELRGLAVDPVTGHFFLYSPTRKRLYELDQRGVVMANQDMSDLDLNYPQGITFGPSGDRTDDPSIMSLYFHDEVQSGPGAQLDGRANPGGEAASGASSDGSGGTNDIVELSSQESVTALSAADAGSLVQTIDTSLFVPPSPDAAGITYRDTSDSLFLSDSEVNEMTIFDGVNLFEIDVFGNQLTNLVTTDFSNEPTGAASNPANGHLFIADDNGNAVYEIDPGPDALFNTIDDIVTSIDTTVFGSGDAEGVTYDSLQGHLFIVDGVNDEVYEISPGANMIFDGAPPQGDDVVSSFDTAALGVTDPEGIGYDFVTNRLYIVGKPSADLAEVSTSGSLIRTLDISAANAVKPAGVTVGPGSLVSTDRNIYIVDRGVDNGKDPNENDGKLYEMNFPPLASGNDPPTVSAGPDQSITLPSDATLDGTASDDGVPSPPALATTWTQFSGPGTVTFADASAEDTNASFSTAGVYVLRLTADDGELSSFDDVMITVQSAGGGNVVDVRVSASTDDAEERASGTMSLTSSDLELVATGSTIQTVGIRWVGVDIPPGSVIDDAHIQFQEDENNTEATFLTIEGETTANPGTFLSSTGNVSSRPRTSASVAWSPPPWTNVPAQGPDEKTSNIAAVIQEIVDGPGWFSGSSLVLIITGSGTRTAEAWDGVAAAAPLLHVEFSGGNAAPIVTINSPPDGAIFEPGTSILFEGSASDAEDGDLSASIDWDSDVDRPLGTGASFSRSDLSAGVHTITATVMDSGGRSEMDTVQIAIAIGGNVPPTVTVGSPANGGTFFVGETISFTGTASDFEDGDLTANMTWSSSQDGVIGSGGSFTSSSLSIGSHVITASVVDNGSLTGLDQISIEVSDAAPAVLVGAGDITDCTEIEDDLTADLLDSIPGTVFTAGDNAYENGSDLDFAQCYEPTWGRHKARTRPALGNHDYVTPGASGHFNYFGAAAGDPDKGYYSYDIGKWHVVVLNSMCAEIGGCERTSPQGQWLEADLAANPAACTVAISHFPLYGSDGGFPPRAQDFWQILYEAGADLMVSGHRHMYERFAPQDANGVADPNGMPQFVVGTGGTGLSADIGTLEPNSVVRDNTTFGVLKLTLYPTSYDWEFVGAPGGGTFTDSGSAACVGNMPPTVVISSPADGTTFAEGATVDFSGSASDSDDGDISFNLSWTSSIDGLIGTGASLSTTLSSGTHTITASVIDSGGLTTDKSISVTITGTNDPPTISDIPNQTTDEDTPTGALAFTVGDTETAAGSLTVSGSSDNPVLVPEVNLVFGGTGAARTLTVTPAADESGTATITVTVSDGTDTSSDTFVLTVLDDADKSISVTITGTNDPADDGK